MLLTPESSQGVEKVVSQRIESSMHKLWLPPRYDGLVQERSAQKMPIRMKVQVSMQ